MNMAQINIDSETGKLSIGEDHKWMTV